MSLGRSGTFVARTCRDRPLIALAELSREHGYGAVSVEQVALRAGWTRAAFERDFATKDICLGEAYRAAVAQALDHATRAYERARGDWARATMAALTALLKYIAGTPAFAHLCIAEAVRHQHLIEQARQDVVRSFGTFMRPGCASLTGPVPSPQVLTDLLAGGIYDVIQTHVLNDCLDELPGAVPGLTIYLLAPFVGNERAARIATSAP